MIHFTRHFSRIAAEKHYGDLGARYRGNAQSDYFLTIYEGREDLIHDLGEDYNIDFDKRTITEKERK